MLNIYVYKNKNDKLNEKVLIIMLSYFIPNKVVFPQYESKDLMSNKKVLTGTPH